MPGRFLEISVFLGDYFIMPHPVYCDLPVPHRLQKWGYYTPHTPVTPPTGMGNNSDSII